MSDAGAAIMVAVALVVMAVGVVCLHLPIPRFLFLPALQVQGPTNRKGNMSYFEASCPTG